MLKKSASVQKVKAEVKAEKKESGLHLT